MSLRYYLDKGASLGDDQPCLVMDDRTLSYADVQQISRVVAAALHRSGINPGDKVAVLSGNDPLAFACVFGISRAGALWCPINPRNGAEENRSLLELFDCTCLIFQSSFATLVESIAPDLPQLRQLVCLDGEAPLGLSYEQWTAAAEGGSARPAATPAIGPPTRDTIMLVSTGGTTGEPKGVEVTDRNIETMVSLTLMSYPFVGRPTYLALPPLTHAAGAMCFPILALGGQVVIMARPDPQRYLELIERHHVTHTFLPPTVIYALLAHPRSRSTDYSSLQCFWYGAAPMSAARLEEALDVFGPVMAQFFGQAEAAMMISTMSPAQHFRSDGSVALERLSSAGRPSPLVTVAIMDDDGALCPPHARGEIVVRGSLVMAGYYKNPEATAQVSVHGWHHTGDIGYLDDDNWLYIVDRAKDMIITGGFNVYSSEVERALMAHPDVFEAAVIGLPDDKWGERVTAVVQLRPGREVSSEELTAFVKSRLGSVKTPKQIERWTDLPRSKVGKVLKGEIRLRFAPP